MRHCSVRKPKSLQSNRDEKKSAHLVIAVVEPRRDQRSYEVAHHGDHPVGVDGLNVVGHESPASYGVHAQEELNRRRNPLSLTVHTESRISQRRRLWVVERKEDVQTRPWPNRCGRSGSGRTAAKCRSSRRRRTDPGLCHSVCAMCDEMATNNSGVSRAGERSVPGQSHSDRTFLG